MKIYSLEILRIAELLTISVKNVRLRPLNSTGNSSRIDVMCFARYGAMPSATLHDYSGNLNKSPLVIHSPKAGRLYITILPLNLSKEIGVAQGNASTVCYSLELQALECPLGKAGPTCSAERYMLQVGVVNECVFSVSLLYFALYFGVCYVLVLYFGAITKLSAYVKFNTLNNMYLFTFVRIK